MLLHYLIPKRDDGRLPRGEELVECMKAGPVGTADVELFIAIYYKRCFNLDFYIFTAGDIIGCNKRGSFCFTSRYFVDHTTGST